MEPPANLPSTSIGLIGCGRWGKYILRDLVSLGCSTWVVARSTTSIQNAKDHRAHRIVGSIAELPEDLQGYVVAVNTVYHAPVIRELLARDRPVFVEKPLSSDLGSAEELVRMAGNRLFVMDKWRHHPGIEALAVLVRSGELGKTRLIRTRRNQWGSSHQDVDPVWTLLPHDLSIVLHLLKELPAPLWAVGEQVAEDWFLSLSGQLGADTLVFVEVSAHAPIKERGVIVSFEHGAAMMADPLADHLLLRRGPPTTGAALEKVSISTEFPLLRELRAFLAYLHGGPAPHSSAQDGLRMVQIIARMRDMATARRP